MPNHVGQLIRALAPVVRDARNAAACDARPRAFVVDLADDRVLGTHRGRNRGDRCGDGGLPPVPVNRLERGWRVGHCQLSRGGEKFRHSVELAIIDPGGIAVHQVREGRPVGGCEGHTGSDSRCAQADRVSLACSISVIGGMASTIR